MTTLHCNRGGCKGNIEIFEVGLNKSRPYAKGDCSLCGAEHNLKDVTGIDLNIPCDCGRRYLKISKVTPQGIWGECPQCGEREKLCGGGTFPLHYLKHTYWQSRKDLNPLYLNEWAERIARELVQAKLDPLWLERVFEYVKRLAVRLENGADWKKEVYTDLLRLESMAAKAVENGEVPEFFYRFVRKNLKEVKSPSDFLRAFLPHFEAVLAFFYYHTKNQKKEDVENEKNQKIDGGRNDQSSLQKR